MNEFKQKVLAQIETDMELGKIAPQTGALMIRYIMRITEEMNDE